MELSSSNIKNVLYFLKRKLFLYFRKRKPPKKLFIFQEVELSYISGNRNPKKLFIFQKITLQAQKIKKTTLKNFLYFRKQDFLTPNLRNYLYSI